MSMRIRPICKVYIQPHTYRPHTGFIETRWSCPLHLCKRQPYSAGTSEPWWLQSLVLPPVQRAPPLSTIHKILCTLLFSQFGVSQWGQVGRSVAQEGSYRVKPMRYSLRRCNMTANLQSNLLLLLRTYMRDQSGDRT
jgi:hypothetical protein